MGQLQKLQQIHYGDIGEEIKDKKITFETINFPRLMSDTKQIKKVQRTPTIHDRF